MGVVRWFHCESSARPFRPGPQSLARRPMTALAVRLARERRGSRAVSEPDQSCAEDLPWGSGPVRPRRGASGLATAAVTTLTEDQHYPH